MGGSATAVVSIVSDEPGGRLRSSGVSRDSDTSRRTVFAADPQIIRRLLARFGRRTRSCHRHRAVARRRIGGASCDLADGGNQLPADACAIVPAWRRWSLIRNIKIVHTPNFCHNEYDTCVLAIPASSILT